MSVLPELHLLFLIVGLILQLKIGNDFGELLRFILEKALLKGFITTITTKIMLITKPPIILWSLLQVIIVHRVYHRPLLVVE